MVVVAEEDHVDYGRTTSRNGQASRRRHCRASQTTEVDGQVSQQMQLSEYLRVRGISWSVSRTSAIFDLNIKRGNLSPPPGKDFLFGVRRKGRKLHKPKVYP